MKTSWRKLNGETCFVMEEHEVYRNQEINKANFQSNNRSIHFCLVDISQINRSINRTTGGRFYTYLLKDIFCTWI